MIALPEWVNDPEPDAFDKAMLKAAILNTMGLGVASSPAIELFAVCKSVPHGVLEIRAYSDHVDVYFWREVNHYYDIEQPDHLPLLDVQVVVLMSQLIHTYKTQHASKMFSLWMGRPEILGTIEKFFQSEVWNNIFGGTNNPC